MQRTAEQRLSDYRDRVETALQLRLSPGTSRLHDAMRYSVLGGGKRIRAALVYATGELTGRAAPTDLDLLACLVEMVHAYSLVHDDLPAMDNADLRRNQPSCHRAYSEAEAILVGDALQVMAFGLLVELDNQSHLRDMLRVLRDALGTDGMVAGQALELEYAAQPCDEALLLRVHWMKTGALIQASLLLGGMVAGCERTQMQTLARIGECLGRAFQVVDDLQDWADENEAFNYVTVLGKDRAIERCEQLHGEAVQHLQTLPGESQALRDMSHLLSTRWSWE